MKKTLSLAISAAALAYAPAVSAADFFPGDPEFVVSGDPTTGDEVVTAFLGRNIEAAGSETDTFTFQIGPETGFGIGLGSGSIITTFTVTGGDLDFTSVTFDNGVDTFIVPITELAAGPAASIGNIPIFSGNVNVLTVDWTATGEASYGGQLTFTPGGVPEPMTWAMMIIGFAAVGFAMRRRREDQTARVRYAF